MHNMAVLCFIGNDFIPANQKRLLDSEAWILFPNIYCSWQSIFLLYQAYINEIEIEYVRMCQASRITD